jgi:hypothetical protein
MSTIFHKRKMKIQGVGRGWKPIQYSLVKTDDSINLAGDIQYIQYTNVWVGMEQKQWVAQLLDEKSTLGFRIDISWSMGSGHLMPEPQVQSWL